MTSAKPVRVIDVSKELKIATSTIIEFLKNNNYPVDRSYHTPLLPEILAQIGLEFANDGQVLIITQLRKTSKTWEAKHSEQAEKIRSTYERAVNRQKLKQQRAEKMRKGRERSKKQKEEYQNRLNAFNETMQSAATVEDTPEVTTNGQIAHDYLQMDIIHKALQLSPDNKKKLLRYLRHIHDIALRL